MALRQHIPNCVTLLNLLSGSIAVLYAASDQFVYAALFMSLGIFLDFFDGLIARMLGVQSDIGIQLDSLADMVTSGLLPGIVMYKLMKHALDNSEKVGWNGDQIIVPLACVGLLVTLATAYRLAKFNIDEDQQTYFKGLPSPANAILIVSLTLIKEFQNFDVIENILSNYWALVALTLLSSYMLIMPMPLFSLKFKGGGVKANWNKYLLVSVSAILLLVFKFVAIPIIILFYVLLSVFTRQQILSKF